jgi:hypothetical protein
MFYEDDEFLELESGILEQTSFKASSLTHSQAARHLKEGFIRRHLMMQSSRIFMRENTQPSRTSPLSSYLSVELGVHVNAYYLNLCGALDNLAWLLTYELALNPRISEEDRSRNYCNLFGERFLNDLRTVKPSLTDTLQAELEWNKDIRMFRDPAAHRIPLYAAPGVLNEADIDEYRKIESMASKSEEERDGEARSSILQRARELAKYYPVMMSSSSSELQVHSIPDQIAKDHRTFLRVAEAVIKSL